MEMEEGSARISWYEGQLLIFFIDYSWREEKASRGWVMSPFFKKKQNKTFFNKVYNSCSKLLQSNNQYRERRHLQRPESSLVPKPCHNRGHRQWREWGWCRGRSRTFSAASAVAATTCFPPTLICIQPNPLLCTLSAATLWYHFLVEQLELKMVSCEHRCVLQCAVHCSAAMLEHGSLCTFVYQSYTSNY